MRIALTSAAALAIITFAPLAAAQPADTGTMASTTTTADDDDDFPWGLLGLIGLAGLLGRRRDDRHTNGTRRT